MVPIWRHTMRATNGLQTTITLGSVNHDGPVFSLGLSLEMSLNIPSGPVLGVHLRNAAPQDEDSGFNPFQFRGYSLNVRRGSCHGRKSHDIRG